MVETHELSKTFQDKKRGTIHAVDSVSLQANSGEIFGILGPNGAGKPTAKIIEEAADTWAFAMQHTGLTFAER